jgi:uncharacterized protein with PIN domain
MKRATFRCYAELADFLPPARRGVAFEHAFEGSPAVKDLLEALGVPHTEVDLLLAGGAPVGFDWRVEDGARVAVYPVFESFDVAGVSRVRAEPLRETRFLLDGHLGRLARYLRMAGLDVAWERDAADAALARVAPAERRILLTRDRGLLKRRAVTHGYVVRATDARAQLAEVIRRFDLARRLAPFSRCLRCNAPLAEVDAAEVAAEVPPRVRERAGAYRRCPGCRRIYWAGTHHRAMERLLAEALAAGRDR